MALPWKSGNPGCACCDQPPPCVPILNITVWNPCRNYYDPRWTVTVAGPGGFSATSNPAIDGPFFGPNISAGGDGAYTITATLTLDLSPYGGPTSYAMTDSVTVEVPDHCNPPPVTIDVCESWVAFRVATPCATPGTAPSPGESPIVVTVDSPLGSWSGRAGDWICFTGFDCFAISSFTATVAVDSPASLAGSCTITVPTCPVNPLGHGPYTCPDGGIHPAAGYHCDCCNVPIPDTCSYSDSTGLTATLTKITDPADPGFSGIYWMGSGTGNSIAAQRADAYSGCCVPDNLYVADIYATCQPEIGVGGKPTGRVFWQVKKAWHMCQATAPCNPASTPACSISRDPHVDPAHVYSTGRSRAVDCDPTGMVLSGTLRSAYTALGQVCNPPGSEGDFTLVF